jgi:hypothetical protein
MSRLPTDDGYASIRVKDFSGRTEDYVREEFLIPLFRAAGYDAFGPYLIVRGRNLSAATSVSRRGRRHIYPDFVLESQNIPHWVVDAKSARVKLHIRKHYRQIIAYSIKLKTRNLILSNALETCIFRCTGNSLEIIRHFELHHMDDGLWHELIDTLRPERTVQKWLSFEKALHLYNTDNYVDRLLLMRVLQTYGFETTSKKLKDFGHSDLYRATSFRSKALASILIAPYAQRDPLLFSKITEWSLGDRDCVVRENCITTILSNWPQIGESLLPHDILSIDRHTVLEEIVHWSLLRCTTKWETIQKTCGPRDPVIKRYIDLIEPEAPVSFPIALVLRKPPLMTYERFVEHLILFPALAERIYDNDNTHLETKKVLGYCVAFAKTSSPKVMDIVCRSATARQNEILIEAATLAMDSEEYALTLNTENTPTKNQMLAGHSKEAPLF